MLLERLQVATSAPRLASPRALSHTCLSPTWPYSFVSVKYAGGRPLLVRRHVGGVRREQRIDCLQGETRATGIPLTEPGAIVTPPWGTIGQTYVLYCRAPGPSIDPNSFCVYSGVSGLARGPTYGPTKRAPSGAPEETVDSVPPPGAEKRRTR